MTSLIDVIFLLLMFFMLSTTFTRTTELPLAAATSGTGVAADSGAAPVFLRLAEQGVTLNGQSIAPDQAAAAVQALAGPDARVLVAMMPGVTAQRLADLLVDLRAVPGLRVQVLG